MKILIFNWQDIKNPLSGGAEVHLHEIFSRIAKMGHEVTLFCSSFKDAKHEEMINGIHVIREGGRYLFNFRVPFKYFLRFRKENYDVVIDDMNKIPFYTPLYVRKPLFIIVHHLFDKSIFLEASFPLALYVYLSEKLGVWLCKKFKVPMIVVSPSTRDELIQKGFSREKIEIVHNCVDHSAYKSDATKRSATPVIGYFGRLKKYKSIEHLLHAFKIVRQEIPNLQLLIIGEGDNKYSLQELAKNLEISDAVYFTGFVDGEEKVRLLQKVWFIVNTSSKEGWGLTVIESNACGTPVIASNVPGLRDAIKDGETGLLYEYGNIKELADKIIKLLNDNELRTRLGENAKLWSSSFDWSVSAEKMLNLLNKNTR